MMNAQALITHSDTLFKKCLDVMRRKNADYSGGEGDAFRNFLQVENLDITSVEAGMMVRLSDKFSRMATLVKKDPQVIEEKLEDTIEDAINYLAIMHAYLTDKKSGGRRRLGKEEARDIALAAMDSVINMHDKSGTHEDIRTSMKEHISNRFDNLGHEAI